MLQVRQHLTENESPPASLLHQEGATAAAPQQAPGVQAALLKMQTQTELNIPRRSHRPRYHTHTRTSDVLARKIELGMVQDVEEFPAELQPVLLRQRKFLEHGCIHVGAAGTAKNSSTRIAECVERWRR